VETLFLGSSHQQLLYVKPSWYWDGDRLRVNIVTECPSAKTFRPRWQFNNCSSCVLTVF